MSFSGLSSSASCSCFILRLLMFAESFHKRWSPCAAVGKSQLGIPDRLLDTMTFILVTVHKKDNIIPGISYTIMLMSIEWQYALGSIRKYLPKYSASRCSFQELPTCTRPCPATIGRTDSSSSRKLPCSYLQSKAT
jgi:hypothetical protein